MFGGSCFGCLVLGHAGGAAKGRIAKGGGWCLARIERGISVLSGLGFIALGLGEAFYNPT